MISCFSTSEDTMPLLLLSLILTQHASAQNNSTSTALEGWQFNDGSRSTWDMVWTCLLTMVACTWTALRPAVPKRDDSNTVILARKAWQWFIAILAPELMAYVAADQFYRARSTAALCNSAQTRVNTDKKGLLKSQSQLHSPNQTMQTLKDGDLHPVRTEWTLAQGFCIGMKGLFLKTQDNWLYPVKPTNVETLIQADLIQYDQFTNRDIEDRAKADFMAIALTVLQSSWICCSTVARAAYDLPVSPLEIATVAYVACAIITYGLWWHKPKDMITPININLPFDREHDIPQQARDILKEEEWIQLKIPSVEKKSLSLILKGLARRLLPMDNRPRVQVEDKSEKQLTMAEETVLSTIALFAALIFCGIHLAA